MRLSDVCQPIITDVPMSMDIFMTGYRNAQILADDKAALGEMAAAQQWKHYFNFNDQLFLLRNTVLVTTPQLKIVFASSSIIGLSGYTPKEVIGNTPALFQGAKTNVATKKIMRQSIDKRTSFDESIINYRKNGSLYRCHIKSYPLFNRNKDLVNFIAFEKEIAMAG